VDVVLLSGGCCWSCGGGCSCLVVASAAHERVRVQVVDPLVVVGVCDGGYTGRCAVNRYQRTEMNPTL